MLSLENKFPCLTFRMSANKERSLGTNVCTDTDTEHSVSHWQLVFGPKPAHHRWYESRVSLTRVMLIFPAWRQSEGRQVQRCTGTRPRRGEQPKLTLASLILKHTFLGHLQWLLQCLTTSARYFRCRMRELLDGYYCTILLNKCNTNLQKYIVKYDFKPNYQNCPRVDQGLIRN